MVKKKQEMLILFWPREQQSRFPFLGFIKFVTLDKFIWKLQEYILYDHG